MFFLKAQLSIAPEYRSAFLEHIRALIATSSAEEGCGSFECCEEIDSPNSFIVLEEWSDQESLARHERSDHLAEFKRKVGGMITSRRETRVYSVSDVAGLEKV